MTAGDHVRLEENALEEDIVVAEGLEDGGVHLLAHLLALVDAVAAVGEHFRLDDGHQAALLADGGVAGQAVAVLENGRRRRLSVADSKDCTPLGKTTPGAVVAVTAHLQVVQTLRGRLAPGAEQRHQALVHLDAGDDGLALEHIRQNASLVVLLGERLLVEDDAADVVGQLIAAKQHLPVLTAVLIGVGNAQLVEALANGAHAFVGGENALSRSGDAIGRLVELILNILRQHHIVGGHRG